MVSLYTECVNDEFFAGEDIFKQLWQLIRSVVFDPNVTNNAFDPDVTEREKRNVRDRIRSIYDDKTRFAQKRMLEIMRPDHPASILFMTQKLRCLKLLMTKSLCYIRRYDQ